MSDDDNRVLPAVRRQDDLETQIIEEVYAVDNENAQLLIVRHLQAIEAAQSGSRLELFLQSFWNHLEGARVVSQDGNFELATELQKDAADGFQQLGFQELESVSRGLSVYATANVELRRLNINRGLELMTATEVYFRNAGRFGSKFRQLIDQMKPEALFVGVLPALMAGDTDSARVLASQASNMSKRVAEKYYEKGSPGYFTFLGLAEYYEATLSYLQSQIDLSNLDLDRLVSEDISARAREADRLLAQADLTNLQIQFALHVSRALVELLDVTKGVASRMQLCFKAAFKPDLQGFLDLRNMARRAIVHASNAGPQAVSIVRSCDGLLARIQNLERLARPKKTDFGVYSGLISAALFVPLLLVASWARNTFGFDLDGKTLFLTIVGLALIGGFGFGALRFKNFLFTRPQGDDNGAQ